MPDPTMPTKTPRYTVEQLANFAMYEARKLERYPDEADRVRAFKQLARLCDLVTLVQGEFAALVKRRLR